MCKAHGSQTLSWPTFTSQAIASQAVAGATFAC